MPVAAVVAGALTDTAVHPFGLFVGGLNVIDRTEIESIEVVEAGPGAVSSMTFAIDDPTKEVAITDGTEVAFWDLAGNACKFRGVVDAWSSDPDFGGQGRTIRVECAGVESWLDWLIVPPDFFFVGTTSLSRLLGVIVQRYAPMLRAPNDDPMGAPFTRAGSAAYPVGSLVRPFEPSEARIYQSLSTPPGSLRAKLQNLVAAAAWFDTAGGAFIDFGVKVLQTVDFNMGFRVWENDPAVQPDDYTTLTIVDTPAGALQAGALSAAVDYSGVVRSVYVTDGTGVGIFAIQWGPFSDGTGIQGLTELITDPLITTEAGARARAAAEIAEQSASVRGSFELEDWAPPATVHAGSLVSITDAATGTATTYRIHEIVKTFHKSGRETWKVAFGGMPRSGARLMRKLIYTRGQSS